MAALNAFERHILQTGIVTDDKLKRAKSEAEKSGVALVSVMEQLGFASAETIYESLARFCEMRYVVPSKLDIPEDVVERVPARFATHYKFVPIQVSNGSLVVAVSDPLNSHLLDDIRLVLKQRIEADVATPEDIEKTTKSLYGLGANTM